MEEREFEVGEDMLEYFERQIKGLIMILEEGSQLGEIPMIHRDYVIEKLNMILNAGINFHPSIIERLDEKQESSVV